MYKKYRIKQVGDVYYPQYKGLLDLCWRTMQITYRGGSGDVYLRDKQSANLYIKLQIESKIKPKVIYHNWEM